MQELLITIVKGLVENPDAVSVTVDEVDDRGVVVYHLHVAEDDMGRVIGKQGRIAKAIRTVVKAGATRTGEKVQVDIKELVLSVKQMVYESDGKIKVSELKEQTGYSERYINKVFLEEMGFSPKTFCKIIQFQRALEFLNYGAPDRMTDAAVALGYYDQAQFIRDFTRYAGITPKKYLKLVEEQNYKSKIKQTNCLE